MAFTQYFSNRLPYIRIQMHGIHKIYHGIFLSQSLYRLTNVFLIEPLDYLPFVYLMNHSTIVLTDSGGIQEEAPGLGKPVLVMRDTTERPEALEAGTVKLVGTGYNSIIDNVSDLLENKDLYRQMSKAQNPYGDGKTSQSIVNILL